MTVLLLVLLMLPYNSLKITKSGTNHLYHFANKRGSFWVNESAKESRHFLMGYIAHRETIFSDYRISGGGLLFDRKTASVEYEPHVFRRRFSTLTEEVFMPDTLDALVFTFTVSGLRQLDFSLFMNGSIAKNAEQTAVPTVMILETDKTRHRYIAVASESGFGGARKQNSDVTFTVKTAPLSGPLQRANVAVGSGSTRQEAIRHAMLALGNEQALKLAKRNRLEELIERSAFFTENPDLARAFAWSLISFDALNANEKKTGLGEGIYAGYPWFQDYWGRDSFIALRALTVTGQTELARINLESFLKFQILNDTSSAYGKVPNRVRPDESIYNTADATPRFIIEAARYVQWTGDYAFVRNISANLTAAIRGTLKYRVDADGLLTHGDADTWMDAVGPKGPYSPRGNRANDIQALWIDALNGAAFMLKQLPESPERKTLLTEVDAARTKATKAFQEKFINKTGEGAVVFDAITAAGVPDAAIRPNQLFVLSLLPDAERSRVLEQTTATLGTPYGLLSLDPSHPWFHPFHKYEPVYEQDASYHNGIIWLWNTGEWLSHLISANAVDLAGEVAVNYSQVILNGPALGTLPELADAFPRQPGSSANYPDAQQFGGISRIDQMSLRNDAGLPATVPPFSGTFSQAWSLSEYLRNAVEDFGGFKPQDDGALGVVPAFPLSWKKYQVRTYYRGWELTSLFTYENGGWQWRVDASPSRKAQPVPLLLQGPGQKNSFEFFLNRNADTIELVQQGGNVSVKQNGATLKTPANGKNLKRFWTFSSPLRFADFSGYDHNRMNYKSQHTN